MWEENVAVLGIALGYKKKRQLASFFSHRFYTKDTIVCEHDHKTWELIRRECCYFEVLLICLGFAGSNTKFLACICRNVQSVNGTLHPKMKILSPFTHPPLVPNQYEFLSSAEHKSRYFEECVTKLLTVAIDFNSMVANNCLDTHILQNNLFCVQQKKESHMSYPFNKITFYDLSRYYTTRLTGFSLLCYIKCNAIKHNEYATELYVHCLCLL